MNRDFKGIWIPREIWLSKLSCIEKCVWAEIHSLFDRDRGGCYASNEYLCEFFGLKDRRLREIIYKLRDLGWIQEVSFDGRNRVIKAVVPPEDFKPEVRAKQTGGKVPPCVAEKCQADRQETANPSLYIEQSVGTSLETPPIPPKKEDAAKAAEIELKDSSKPKREKNDFSPKAREIANLMINSLSRTKPNYVPPKNLSAMLTEVDFALRLDKRDPELFMDVFNWALADSFWADKMFKPNPAKYLREKFDQLEMKMLAKPEQPKKERKFAASSDDKAALECMEEMNKRAL